MTKKAGTKPRRNRIKRRLSEALRNVPGLPERMEGRDVIVSAGLKCLDAPFPDLVAALDLALKETRAQ